MLSKKDATMAQGLAIVGMVMLHLFCRLDHLPYDCLVYVGNVPLIYYFGLFGDLCVPVYCFCSGYAQCVLFDRDSNYGENRYKRVGKFLIHFWIVLILFSIVGLIFGGGRFLAVYLNFLGISFFLVCLIMGRGGLLLRIFY